MTYTVKDLKKQIQHLPDDMAVMIFSPGTNGFCHEEPVLRVRNKYVLEVQTDSGWQYEEVYHPILEIE